MIISWDLYLQCLASTVSHSTPAFPGDPPKPTSKTVLDSHGVPDLPWDPLHRKLCVHTPRAESLFPANLWCWRLALLVFSTKWCGAPPPSARPQGWQTWHGVQNAHSYWRASEILLFSNLWVICMADIAFLILWKHPSYCLVVASSLSLGVG